LAWAITIHKSQGLTFERAIIDAQASFAHGQVYVALSRCKTLEGMVLSTPIGTHSIINDRTVSGFTQYIEQNQPNEAQLHSAKITYQHELLRELFSFEAFRSRIVSVEKAMFEHSNTIPAPTQALFPQMLPPLQMEIIDVAEKFQNQMRQFLHQQPDAEQNAALQERIGKASAYFSEKIKTHILNAIAKADLDIDNKTVKKQLNNIINRLEDEARIKQDSLNACCSGFRVADLLQAKAVAAIEKTKPKTVRKFEASESSEIKYPILFERLRAWRKEKADEMDKPVFHVFSQKSLYELVHFLPAETKALLRINGFGQKKVEQFGEQVLQIIHEYCTENNIDNQTIIFEKETPKLRMDDTKQISYNLYKSGKTIEEIATERELATSTIEGHLAHYIVLGELDIHQFLAEEKLQTITDYFQKTEDQNLTPARETLGETYSYGELRMVREWLRTWEERGRRKIKN
jgi:DNA-binding CsgD family transcriptional regulator